jgi:hypothetical protein
MPRVHMLRPGIAETDDSVERGGGHLKGQ